MRQTPELQEIQNRMRPGRMTRDGMLGTDPRTLREILEADQAAVQRLRVRHEEIARRLEELMAAGRERLGDVVVLESAFELRVDEPRGSLLCPFGHPGRFRKGMACLRHIPTSEELRWTPLSAHMIGHHGFYGGVGSPFRLDPERVVRILGLAGREP